MQNLPVNSLFRRHAFGRVGFVGAHINGGMLEKLDHARQGFVVGVENHVLAQFPHVGGNFGEWHNVRGIDDRSIQTRFDGVIQKYRVERGASVLLNAKRQIRHAQHRFGLRNMLFDQPNAVQCFLSRSPQFGLAGRDGKRQRIEQPRIGLHPVIILANLHHALGDGEFAFGGMRHAFVVYRQTDDRRTVARNQRHGFIEFLFASAFQRGRIDDGATWVHLQRRFQHVGFGRVDHERQFHAHRQLFEQFLHLLFFIRAFGHRHADIKRV